MMTLRAGRRAFTIIELLTVIAIIGILASMLLVVANLSRRRAKEAQAKAEVRELAKAWKTYWVVYGRWPSGADRDREMTPDMMRHLQGENPQGIKFMDVGSDAVTIGYKDPWDHLYRVDFSRVATPSIEEYETIVWLPNRNRYKYE